MGKRTPIRKAIDNRDAPLPQVWSSFIATEEDKADLARFRSEAIMQKVWIFQLAMSLWQEVDSPKPLKLDQQEGKLSDFKEIMKKLIQNWFFIHVWQSVKAIKGCLSSPVIQMLCCFSYTVYQARQLKYGWSLDQQGRGNANHYTQYLRPPLPIMEHLLGLHALTGCDTNCGFSSHGKMTLGNYLLSATPGCRDGTLTAIEQFVCLLYVLLHHQMLTKPDFRSLRRPRRTLRCFLQIGKDLNLNLLSSEGLNPSWAMGQPNQGCTETAHSCTNYQTKIRLQADQEHIHTSPLNTSARIKEKSFLVSVWTTLPPIPDVRLQLVTCACKSKRALRKVSSALLPVTVMQQPVVTQQPKKM